MKIINLEFVNQTSVGAIYNVKYTRSSLFGEYEKEETVIRKAGYGWADNYHSGEYFNGSAIDSVHLGKLIAHDLELRKQKVL